MSSSSTSLRCVKVDLNDVVAGEQVVSLLNAYASDDMGGGEPLTSFTQQHLIAELAKRSSYAHVFVCYVDGVPAGLINSFEGFSTFSCAPLLNLHDVAVLPQYRRKGVAKELLAFVENFARSIGCCKLTLEVLEGNQPAKAVYTAVGFAAYELDPSNGHAVFWQKKLIKEEGAVVADVVDANENANKVIKVDWNDAVQTQQLVELLDAKAKDDIGGGKPLSDFTKQHLIPELSKRSFASAFVCCVDGVPAGCIVAYEGFSTFACAPLLNMHDIVVLPQYRRKGVGRRLMLAMENFARSIGCCKLTLEVLEGNQPAKAAYTAVGFAAYELDPSNGHAVFWQKKLN